MDAEMDPLLSIPFARSLGSLARFVQIKNDIVLDDIVLCSRNTRSGWRILGYVKKDTWKLSFGYWSWSCNVVDAIIGRGSVPREGFQFKISSQVLITDVLCFVSFCFLFILLYIFSIFNEYLFQGRYLLLCTYTHTRTQIHAHRYTHTHIFLFINLKIAKRYSVARSFECSA